MLKETEVIKAVKAHLKDNGWEKVSTSKPHQRGIDILAEFADTTMAIEAKGGTSSKSHTARFGKPFSSNQKKSHVSRALYTAACTVSDGKHWTGIAVPDDENHERLILDIERALKKLKVTAFLVNDSRKVRELGYPLRTPP